MHNSIGRISKERTERACKLKDNGTRVTPFLIFFFCWNDLISLGSIIIKVKNMPFKRKLFFYICILLFFS